MSEPRGGSPRLGESFETFRDFLYETSGIYFPQTRKERLIAHVAARMKTCGTPSPDRYLSLLRSSPRSGGELTNFLNEATVNETYFFREEAQFDVFRDKVLPQLYESRRKEGRPGVNIWSAACSSGEEAYSLAILLKESFPGELAHTSIVGFDINSEVVEKARRAEYTEYSVRHFSDEKKRAYFKKEGERYRLVPYLKRLATFQVINFTDSLALKQLPKPDLILCRNVLIYFDKKSKEKAINQFGKLLPPNGYLFLSQTESMFGIEHSFEMVHFFKVFGYRPKR